MDTEYGGHVFHNRLEARWAVFFDEVGLEYEYCRESEITDRNEVIPTFYIPREDIYFKIVSKPLTPEEVKEVDRFCLNRKKRTSRFAVAIGLPTRFIDRRAPIPGIWEYSWIAPGNANMENEHIGSASELVEGKGMMHFQQRLWAVPGIRYGDLKQAIKVARAIKF